MKTASRTIARMWKRRGFECSIHKHGDEWVLRLEQDGRILDESQVESPGEAIRKSEELLKSIDKLRSPSA